jgi:hypothetical protein
MALKTLHIYLISCFLCTIHAQGLKTFDELLTYSFTSKDSLQLQILEAKKDYVLKDKGLRVNSSAGTNEFGDLETGNIFRLKAGLEWNLLDEGYMDRKISSKILDINKSILELEMQEKSFIDNYAFIYNHIIYCFNKEKIRFLDEKSYLLNILAKRYEALYHNHAAEYQDLLAIADKVDEITILQLSIQNYNNYFEQISDTLAPAINPNYLPVLNVNIKELLSFQIQDTTFYKIQNLKLEKNKLENRLEKQSRLAVYNNVYWRPLQDSGTREGLYNGFGIRFATSLTNRREEREKLDDLEDQLDVSKNEEKNFTRQKELSNFILEYHSKLRLYSRYKYQLRKLQEDKRLDKAVKLVNYKDPQSDLKSLNIDLEKLTVEYELLELKQQLYLLLLKIYKNANVKSILPFVSERTFQDVEKKLKGERILLLNSAFDLEIDATFLAEYLKKNEIHNIIFKGSISQNRSLIKELGALEIKIYSGREAFVHRKMIDVPMDQFSTRIEMEYWIDDHYRSNQDAIYFITDINQLIKIDSAVLEE